MTEPITGPAWDLSDEYSHVDDPELAADLQALDEIFVKASRLNAALGAESAGTENAKLSPTKLDPTELDSIKAAQQLAVISERAGRLLSNVSTFARSLLSVDSQHDGAQKLNGRLQSYRKRQADVFQPLSQYLDAASEAEVDAYLADPAVAPSEFVVRHRRQRRHENLTLAEESLVNGLSQDGISAWGQLYTQLSGSLECRVPVDATSEPPAEQAPAHHSQPADKQVSTKRVSGKQVFETMGIAQASGLLTSANDSQRQAAWRAINAAWQQHEEACAASLNAIAGWRLELCKQRSRAQPVHYLDAPLHMNRISRGTLDALLGAAAEARPVAQRAARLMARAYNKSGFGPWDLRAPAPILSDSKEQRIPFAEAIELIANAFGEVDASMAGFVTMMVDKRWIEGTVGPRKAPGAYCTGFAKSRTPRVYMTYTGGQSDVLTLAHELGHALHSWVMRDLPDSQKNYGMSLAETASTFGEALVRDAMLSRSSSPQEKLNILWEEMSALTTFVLNIPTRFEFERRFYDQRAERPLRPAEFKQLMSDAWTTWYGPALTEPDPMFWASKLHFHISGLSFYNFPYLFGYLFSLGVYTRRGETADGESATLGDEATSNGKRVGASFYQRYVELLRDTGRMNAEDLAKKHLGVRLDEPSFWRETLDGLAARVDAFEALLDEIGRADA